MGTAAHVMTACEVATAVHPALANRFSPHAFDPHHIITDTQIDALIDAARLAPSAGNSQPWRFVVARRGDDIHQALCRHLAGSSTRWAPAASVLIVNIAHRRVAETDWEYSEFADYDLGQAVAHMTVQALAMGFDAHQFRAFDRDGVTRECALPAEWDVVSLTAFGIAAADESRSHHERPRLGRDDITWRRISDDH